MTTEHFTLQTGRSITVADACGRASLFLRHLCTLIALAFIGQISRLGTAFFIFALVLFPSLLFLGLVTFERVLQSAIEDIVYMRGINRIRHLFVELAPQVKDYFILSIHDDEAGTCGKYYHLERAVMDLRAPNDKTPEIWIGELGPRMLRPTGLYGDGWYNITIDSPQEYAVKLQLIIPHCHPFLQASISERSA